MVKTNSGKELSMNQIQTTWKNLRNDMSYWEGFQNEMYEQNMYHVIEQMQDNQLNKYTWEYTIDLA